MDAAFWNKLVLDLVNAMIPVLMTALPVLLTALFGLVVQQIRLIQAKIKNEQPTAYEKLEKICSDAVMIAEQLQLGKFIDDRKKFAVDYVQAEVDKLGLKFDVATIENMIERAVFIELNQ